MGSWLENTKIQETKVCSSKEPLSSLSTKDNKHQGANTFSYIVEEVQCGCIEKLHIENILISTLNIRHRTQFLLKDKTETLKHGNLLFSYLKLLWR